MGICNLFIMIKSCATIFGDGYRRVVSIQNKYSEFFESKKVVRPSLEMAIARFSVFRISH